MGNDPETEGTKPSIDGFEDLFDGILDAGEGDEISIEEIMSAFGRRTYGPLIVAPALLAVLPTGAIPGVPLLLGFVIILVCAQLLAGRESPWIPKRLREMSFPRETLDEAWERFRPGFQRVDKVVHPRLTVFTDTPFVQVIAIICIMLSVLMAPLELIPFAVAVPGLAIAAFGIAISTRDGVIALTGAGLFGASLWLVWWLLL